VKFRDVLDEKYLKTVRAKTFPVGYETVEVFENPAPTEIQSIAKQWGGSVRFGVIDKPNGKIYAWGGEILHPNMKENPDGVDFDFGFYYEFRTPEIIYTDQKYSFARFKNKKKLIERIKKMLPKAKTFRPFGGKPFKI